MFIKTSEWYDEREVLRRVTLNKTNQCKYASFAVAIQDIHNAQYNLQYFPNRHAASIAFERQCEQLNVNIAQN